MRRNRRYRIVYKSRETGFTGCETDYMDESRVKRKLEQLRAKKGEKFEYWLEPEPD